MVYQCPTCDRRFEEIRDFPLVYVIGVSIIKPDEIPKAISQWYEEDLLEKRKRGWNREIVPADVLTYFNTHPDEDELVHSDNFIYKRPLEDTKEFRKICGDRTPPSSHPKFWRRSHNYAPTIRKLMEENQSVKQYFEALEQVVGQEIPTSRLLPNWEHDGYFRVYQIPNADGLALNLNESGKRTNGHRVSEINLFDKGPNMGSAGGPTLSKILQVGHIKYAGRVHHR